MADVLDVFECRLEEVREGLGRVRAAIERQHAVSPGNLASDLDYHRGQLDAFQKVDSYLWALIHRNDRDELLRLEARGVLDRVAALTRLPKGQDAWPKQ